MISCNSITGQSLFREFVWSKYMLEDPEMQGRHPQEYIDEMLGRMRSWQYRTEIPPQWTVVGHDAV